MTQSVPAAPTAAAKQPLADVLRRGLDNTIANWPLFLIRIAEGMLMWGLILAAGFAIVVPLAVSIGLSNFQPADFVGRADAVVALLAQHLMIVVWIFAVVTVLLLLFALVHSFVIAGVARVLADGDRAAGSGAGPRSRFAVFTAERWLAGGREEWWTVFWIYNIAYGVAGLVALLPILLLLLVILALHSVIPMVMLSCLGIALFAMLGLVATIFVSVWCQKAIVIAAAGGSGANEALGLAWRETRADWTTNLAVIFLMLVIGLGGVGALSTISLVVSAPSAAIPGAALFFLPVRILVSIVQTAFGAAVGNWTLASFAAISNSRARTA